MPRPRIGVLLPTRETAIDGAWDWPRMLDFAQEAEQVGFDSLWVGDSLLARPRFDVFLVLAAVGAVTERIELGTACLLPALRNQVVTQSMITSLHQAQGERLTLGLGSGFGLPLVQKEFDATGVPFEKRFGRLDDMVRMWRGAWRGETSFAGRYWENTGLDRLPPPASPGGPALWYAGQDSRRVVERVVDRYDGWLPFMPSPDAFARAWGEIQELAEKRHRPIAEITPAMYATIAANPDREQARVEIDEYAKAYYGYPLEITETVQAFGYGTMDDCMKFLGQFVAGGAEHLVVRIGSLKPRHSLTELYDALRGAF